VLLVAAAIAVLAFASGAAAQEELRAGCTTDVEWTVGDADTVESVNILLVGAAGDTIATLALETPNDGAETVDVPCIEADTLAARLLVYAVVDTPFAFLDEEVVVISAPPTIESSAEGGSVDENCERTVTFGATIGDDCGVSEEDADVTVTLTSDNATLGPIALEKKATEDGLEVTGSFVVSGLTGSPAVIVIEYTAADNCGNAASAADTVMVVDDTPPVVTCPDDVVIECSAPGGTPADDPQLEAFFAGFSADDNCDPEPVVSNDAPEKFELGTTVVTFTATDASGNTSECTANVEVVDTTPPDITLELNRYALWPPNHKFHTIEATVTVSDICDPEPTYVLASVLSNEDANGKGDGNTSPDVHGADTGTADLDFELRAERSGMGDGREYTVVYTASDASGNTASDTAVVIVPHDQSGKARCSNGYNGLGTGFVESSQRFAIIVPSAAGFDATSIDVRHAQIGNAKGVVSPEEIYRGDADGDGSEDIVLVYPTSMTQELHLWAQGHKDKTSLHYSNGVDHWVVYDIFDLGTPVSVDLSALTLWQDDQSGDTGDNDGGDTGGDVDDDTGGGNTGGGDVTNETATKKETRLSAHPNPFNPQTTVTYELATAGVVSVRVYDVNGRLVRTLVNRSVSAGEHAVAWDGLNDRGQRVSSGVYLLRLQAPGQGITKKIVMVK